MTNKHIVQGLVLFQWCLTEQWLVGHNMVVVRKLLPLFTPYLYIPNLNLKYKG